MNVPRLARTKIVVTLGPATQSPEMIEALIEEGVNVFRLNMSHLDHATAGAMIERIRAASDRVAIMADLQGPKMRVTDVDEVFELTKGERVIVRAGEQLTTREALYVPAGDLVSILEPGQRVLIDDGRVRLRVTETRAGEFDAEVIAGGPIKSRKGIACPDVRYRPESYLNAGDRADTAFAVERGVDFIAASYVSDVDDVTTLREAMGEEGLAIGIIAKIESRLGVENIDAILAHADGMMVARGDLGVELPPEEVPLIQKRLIKRAKLVAKPVIVATQMLESMISSPVPSRAETSDVANAILDGTDAMMLSAETSVGAFPLEAVRTLIRVSEHVERETAAPPEHLFNRPAHGTVEFICRAAAKAASELNVKAIVAFTTTGSTASNMAAYEPRVPVLATTPSAIVVRKLGLQYGVHAVQAEHIGRYDIMLYRNVQKLTRAGILEPSDSIVVIGGVPVGIPGSTNMLQVGTVEHFLAREPQTDI
ncbi:MAG: pyruvate kinase [Deltaproteobacteria bacterium]|nr:pyruvate kinase [Deltaproteobacteria bacterium]